MNYQLLSQLDSILDPHRNDENIDNIVGDIISDIAAHLNARVVEIKSKRFDNQIKKITTKLQDLDNITDVPNIYSQSDSSGGYTFVFDDKIYFKVTDNGVDITDLVKFVNALGGTLYPKLLGVLDGTPTPIVTKDIEPHSPHAPVVAVNLDEAQHTHSTPVVSGLSPINDITSTADESSARMVQTRLAIKKIREDKLTQEVMNRATVLQDYCNQTLPILNEYIADIDTYATGVSDEANKVTVDQYCTQYATKHPITTNIAILYAAVEIYQLQSKLKMIRDNLFVAAPLNAHPPLPRDVKEGILALTLSSLITVSEQRDVRPMDDATLWVQLIDYCHAGGLIDVCTQPDQIVDLANNVYEIYATHNFDSDFIYASDVNNRFDYISEHWCSESRVIQMYLASLSTLLKPQPQVAQHLLKDIRYLLDKRDTLMATPKLDSDTLSRIVTIAGDIASEHGICIGENMRHLDDVMSIITIGNKSDDIQILMIITNDIALSIYTREGYHAHTFHKPDNANTLIKQLSYTLNTLQGNYL